MMAVIILIKYWKNKKQDKLYKEKLLDRIVKRFALKSKDALIKDYIKKIPLIKDYVTKINPNNFEMLQKSDFMPLINDLLNANRLKI